MKRAALFCAGRGAYTKRTMKLLPEDHTWVAEAEALRAEHGLPSILEMDRARWDGDVHLRPDNASALIYLHSMLDAAQAMREHDVVCVGGNSLGWYTALAAAGALSFADGFRLVQGISLLQMRHAEGGQVVYPLIDDQWRIDPRLEARVKEALAGAPGEAFPSIDLGGYAVLAGTEKGVAHLLERLPPVEMGPSLYPYRLKQHGPYHTPLVSGVSRDAAPLAGLGWGAPGVTLVDGRGARFTPWSTDPGELAAYTLGVQLTTPFRFTTSVRVALREHAPDLIALPGPGNTLGGVCGQVIVAEGYKGIRSRSDFERVQAGESPVVWSMRR
ncbi:MAG TPA: ACP S-malonyltransferase [Planctomycetota bacterium]|nr:ACP S-malonyltransferase [Planctomycetota bacterium]